MPIPLNVGNLPGNFCPATYQAMLAGFGAALSVTIPSSTGGITISSTKPSSTADIWFRTDSLGRFLGTYLYGQGAWLSPHPSVPGLTQWWFSALPNFTTFDGGDANAPGPASGPMWQQALDGNNNLIAAAFPIAAGNLPSGKVLAIGGTGGEENHTLTENELAPHAHNVSFLFKEVPTGFTGGAAQPALFLNATYPNPTITPTDSDGGGQPHNNIPPYVVGYLLQRTTRLFYSIS